MVAPRMKEFYEWLSPTGVYTRYKIIGKELELCAGNGVPEFLLSDEFQQWSQGPSNLIFCYGNRTPSSFVFYLLDLAGAGKSFMRYNSTSNSYN
jgi:hypothetical protein